MVSKVWLHIDSHNTNKVIEQLKKLHVLKLFLVSVLLMTQTSSAKLSRAASRFPVAVWRRPRLLCSRWRTA